MPPDYNAAVSLQQPTLSLLGSFLTSLTNALERAAEEKSLLLNRVNWKKTTLLRSCFTYAI